MADEKSTSNPPRNFSENVNDYKVYDCGVALSAVS